MELKIGGLIQCRDTHYNRGLGIVGKIGMVAELRRRDVRILFDPDNQSIWVSKQGVNRITLPATDTPALLDRLTWFIQLLDADECELEFNDSGDYRYTVVCGEITLDQIQKVREYMGTLLLALKVVPRGMSRLGLEVVFRREGTSQT